MIYPVTFRVEAHIDAKCDRAARILAHALKESLTLALRGACESGSVELVGLGLGAGGEHPSIRHARESGPAATAEARADGLREGMVDHDDDASVA